MGGELGSDDTMAATAAVAPARGFDFSDLFHPEELAEAGQLEDGGRGLAVERALEADPVLAAGASYNLAIDEPGHVLGHEEAGALRAAIDALPAQQQTLLARAFLSSLEAVSVRESRRLKLMLIFGLAGAMPDKE